MSNFLGIIFKAFKGIDFTLVNNDTVTDQASFGSTRNLARCNHATCDCTHFANFKCVTNFSMPNYSFFIDWIKHTFHCLFNFFNCVINNAMQANIDFFLFRSCFSLAVRTNVKTDDNGIGSRCQNNIGLRDRTSTTMDDLNANAFYLDFLKGALQRFDRTLNVSFDNNIKILDFALFNVTEKIIKGNSCICTKV
ncbi:hypothetical protein D1872_242730 [compost metagenome]